MAAFNELLAQIEPMLHSRMPGAATNPITNFLQNNSLELLASPEFFTDFFSYLQNHSLDFLLSLEITVEDSISYPLTGNEKTYHVELKSNSSEKTLIFKETNNTTPLTLEAFIRILETALERGGNIKISYLEG